MLLQMYSPSGGFTFPHRQLLARLFSESYPKGYWVSRGSFDSALTSKNLHDAGKLKKNAWTLSALVNTASLQDRAGFPSTKREEDKIKHIEEELIENLAREKIRILNAIQTETHLSSADIHIVKVDLTDVSQPGYHNQIAALGFFATNDPISIYLKS